MQISANTELCLADLGPFAELDEGLTSFIPGKQQNKQVFVCTCRIQCHPAMASLMSPTESISVPESIIAESGHPGCYFEDLESDKYHQSDSLSRNK